MTQEFEGRTAIVTGAASGIGLAVATYLAERGARIAGVDLGAGLEDAMAALPGSGHLALMRDLTAPRAADDVVSAVVAETGRLDILVNSAGVVKLAKAVDLSDEAWDMTIAVNLTASFKMARAAGAVMTAAGYGRVINLASQASVVGIDEHVAYCASKSGILGMTRVLALEWGGAGVTVNAVSPTVVETPLGKLAWAGEKGERHRAEIPVGRFAQPEEIAAMIAYLAGTEAAMVTGQNLVIDGGFTIV